MIKGIQFDDNRVNALVSKKKKLGWSIEIWRDDKRIMVESKCKILNSANY